MSNAKEIYSMAAHYYCEVAVPADEAAKKLYESSKRRESKYNENWKKEKVNLIEIVAKYAPNAKVYDDGVKIKFEGAENIIICDKPSAYVRIWNKATRKYFRLDGTLTKSKKRTHFKIKRLEEM